MKALSLSVTAIVLAVAVYAGVMGSVGVMDSLQPPLNCARAKAMGIVWVRGSCHETMDGLLVEPQQVIEMRRARS
jgi:hypothetical protein